MTHFKMIKPSCKNVVVEIQGYRYRADFWELSRMYEFIGLDFEKGYPPMHEKKKSEIDVSNAIKKGIIKII